MPTKKSVKRLAIISLALLASVRSMMYSPEHLRDTYIKYLRSYLHTPYTWGGESHMGIDCSGLIRQAYEDALMNIGISYLRPGLIWKSIMIGSHDFRACDILNDNTYFIPSIFSSNLNLEKDEKLIPGDIAVTTKGSHVIAYIGDGKWIEANGTAKKVIEVSIPENHIRHYNQPAPIFRWKELNNTP